MIKEIIILEQSENCMAFILNVNAHVVDRFI